MIMKLEEKTSYLRTWILDAKGTGQMGPEEPEEIVIGVEVLVNSFFIW